MIDDPAIRRRVIVAAENVDLQKDLQLTKRLLEQERIKTETLSATILKYKTPVQLSEGGSIYKWEQRNQTTKMMSCAGLTTAPMFSCALSPWSVKRTACHTLWCSTFSFFTGFGN